MPTQDLNIRIVARNLTNRGFKAVQKNLATFGAKSRNVLASVGRAFSGFTSILFNLKTAMLGIVAGVAIKAMADFEQAMVQSLAIMGNVSGEMRTIMEKTAREVATTTRFSAKEAADSYFFLASI